MAPLQYSVCGTGHCTKWRRRSALGQFGSRGRAAIAELNGRQPDRTGLSYRLLAQEAYECKRRLE